MNGVSCYLLVGLLAALATILVACGPSSTPGPRVASLPTTSSIMTSAAQPTPAPTSVPSPTPSATPTPVPIHAPTSMATPDPVTMPTETPKTVPSATPMPTQAPTPEPRLIPTPTPPSAASTGQEEPVNPPPRLKDEQENQSEPPAASGVLVETNKQEYLQDEEIEAVVTNNLDTSITTFDQQAFCSIITLEQRIDAEWRKLGRNCFSGAPSRSITLKPHTVTNLKLQTRISPLAPSVYRATILYSMGESFKFGKAFVASSAPFSVQ